MKRYIAEMENDLERMVATHQASASLKESTTTRLIRVRNDYLGGFLPEYSAIEDLMGIMDRFFESARAEQMYY